MLHLQRKIAKENAVLWLLPENFSIASSAFSKEKAKWVKKYLFDAKKEILVLNNMEHPVEVFIRPCQNEKDVFRQMEKCRCLAAKALAYFEQERCNIISVAGDLDKRLLLSVAEGLALASYRFIKYFSNPTEKRCHLSNINIVSTVISKTEVVELETLITAVMKVRDWVNEPASYLNAVCFAEEMSALAIKSGAQVHVLTKKKIETLKMGGLLAVNQGSEIPPTFTIIEWKPEKPINIKPIVLIGKGVTFDTGGSDLKPENYMDEMKSDMAGAATVAATVCVVAQNKLPIHVIALMPSTDNRLSNNSLLPSDIITMHNGKTVEVDNTDAEGRLILADAISYANKYEPQLIIDMATLTGGASRAIGKYGMVAMGNARQAMNKLIQSGFCVFERVAEFPFWKEYADELISEIADISNMGQAEGGTISAGKFLESFTEFPFIHLDIAGCAYLSKPYGWRTKGGTGTGVRLLYDFLKTLIKNNKNE